jgi:hypothetical protein
MKTCQMMLACAILCAACAGTAHAQGEFAGAWKVVDAKPAPWVDTSPMNQPDINQALRHAQIVFRKKSVDGPQPLGCRKVQYTRSAVEPEELFQGGLTDPAAQASALGFRDERIESLNVGCLRSDADLEMDFAMVDHNTLVFALNNVIYRMKRVATARPAKKKQR